VLGVYGATELLPAAVVDAAAKSAFGAGGEPGDLVGRPLPGVRARIRGATHELVLAAPQLASGYLRPHGVEPLAELATGDAARVDSEGRIVLMGRIKEMIIRGSMNIYPGLYEPGVLALPGVAECALVGLPDPVTADERVVLAVVAEPGAAESDVVRRVRAAVPRTFDSAAAPDEIVLLGALPRAGRSGKVDRVALADLLRHRPA
jgi:acyl-CoA synthetase (AMP-forming)/AMP-acid ligase II